jgi:hypothetical protein
VTFPSRAFGTGSERRFFDYLRAVDGTAEPIKRVKAWILDEYRLHHLLASLVDGGGGVTRSPSGRGIGRRQRR